MESFILFILGILTIYIFFIPFVFFLWTVVGLSAQFFPNKNVRVWAEKAYCFCFSEDSYFVIMFKKLYPFL